MALVGLDVGGSLTKVLVRAIEPNDNTTYDNNPLVQSAIKYTSGAANIPTGWYAERLSSYHLLQFPTAELEAAVEQLIAAANAQSDAGNPSLPVSATGGGALKHRLLLESKLQVTITFINELAALTAGWRHLHASTGNLPSLVTNIGTGVSLIRIDKNGFERVTGSGLGGATFWALCRRLTNYSHYDDVFGDIGQGNPGNVDTLVGDIYGVEASSEIGMPPDLVAGFLGKLSKDSKDADVVAGLLRLMASNLGQIAVFQARSLGLKEVWFAGGFVAHPVVKRAVGEAVGFWAQGTIEARFVGQETTLGALGALYAQ